MVCLGEVLGYFFNANYETRLAVPGSVAGRFFGVKTVKFTQHQQGAWELLYWKGWQGFKAPAAVNSMTSPTHGRLLPSVASFQALSCSWLLWVFLGGSRFAHRAHRVGVSLSGMRQDRELAPVNVCRLLRFQVLKNGQFLLRKPSVTTEKAGGEA